MREVERVVGRAEADTLEGEVMEDAGDQTNALECYEFFDPSNSTGL